MYVLKSWAEDWGIPDEAVVDLLQRVDPLPPKRALGKEGSESYAKTEIQLEASRRGWRLWRNNVGVAFGKNGRTVRFGLCNESQKMRKHNRSSDLIGIKPGGQFVAIEVKRPGWSYTGDEHEQGQRNFLQMVNLLGGFAVFARGPHEI